MIFLTKPGFFGTFNKASELIKNERQSDFNLSGMSVSELRNQKNAWENRAI